MSDNTEKSLELLADLLSSTIRTSFPEDASDEDIIRTVLSKMKDRQVAREIKADVAPSLKEEDDDDNPKVLRLRTLDYHSANKFSPLWDYHNVFSAFPQELTVGEWWESLDNLSSDEFLEDYTDFEDIPESEELPEIPYKEISKWLKKLSVNELTSILYGQEPNDLDTSAVYDFGVNPESTFPQFDANMLSDTIDAISESIAKGHIPAKRLNEVLDVQARLKKAIRMRAKAKIIARKRKIALNRKATQEVIEKRARRLARNMLKSRFAGGKKFDDLSYQDKMRVEGILAKKEGLVKALTRKMIPVVRKIERERFEKKSHPTEK